MNIIEPGLVLNPNTMKLIHCKACDATWADKKIPKVCPHCGALKSKLETAKDAESESFMEAYNEMMSTINDTEAGSDEPVEEYGEATVSDSSADQTTDSYEEYGDADTYEPIGYDPDEFANNMVQSQKIKKEDKLKYLSDVEARIRETKWALQRCGLPTDALQTITQDVKNQADKLGDNIPGYVDLMLKMVVDNTVPRELRHPRKNRTYSYRDIDAILSELGVRENYWESYYNVAGLAG